MTIDEIRALIAQKIAGQGTNVDAGGGLPAILNALCDAIQAIPAPTEQVQSDWTENNATLPSYIKHKPSILAVEFLGWNLYDISQVDWETFVQNSRLTSINEHEFVDGQIRYINIDRTPAVSYTLALNNFTIETVGGKTTRRYIFGGDYTGGDFVQVELVIETTVDESLFSLFFRET